MFFKLCNAPSNQIEHWTLTTRQWDNDKRRMKWRRRSFRVNNTFPWHSFGCCASFDFFFLLLVFIIENSINAMIHSVLMVVVNTCAYTPVCAHANQYVEVSENIRMMSVQEDIDKQSNEKKKRKTILHSSNIGIIQNWEWILFDKHEISFFSFHDFFSSFNWWKDFQEFIRLMKGVNEFFFLSWLLFKFVVHKLTSKSSTTIYQIIMCLVHAQSELPSINAIEMKA